MFGCYVYLWCWHVDYIDWFSLTYFSIVTLLIVWLSYFTGHIYSHFCISHSSWHDWFYLLYIILFISTYCLFLLYSYLAYHILAYLVCRYELYTYYLHDCLVHDCSFSMWCMYCLSMWDTHLSPYLQLPSLGRSCFPWSRIMIWDLLLCLLFDRASD